MLNGMAVDREAKIIKDVVGYISSKQNKIIPNDFVFKDWKLKINTWYQRKH